MVGSGFKTSCNLAEAMEVKSRARALASEHPSKGRGGGEYPKMGSGLKTPGRSSECR
jgi:hypothetical protein